MQHNTRGTLKFLFCPHMEETTLPSSQGMAVYLKLRSRRLLNTTIKELKDIAMTDIMGCIFKPSGT